MTEFIDTIEKLNEIYSDLDKNIFQINKKHCNKDEYKIICFCQKAYYKMLNLVRSFNLLLKNGFYDEAYILVRTMYEHNLNYLYITMQGTPKEQIDKIEQWEAYFKKYDESISQKEPINRHWSGLDTFKLNEKTHEILDKENRAILFNIWRQCCLVSHPNIITYKYKNDKGICHVVEKESALIDCLFIFIEFLEYLKHFLEEKFNNNTKIKYIRKNEINELLKIIENIPKQKKT